MRPVWSWWRRRHRDESGYVAIVTAVMFASAFLALAAVAVDTANWYVEAQKVQNAADAAALGGVVYMPHDLASATSTAQAIARRNGYDPATPAVTLTAAQGEDASQLRVTVSSTIRNTFGSLIGVPGITISKTALADFTGPAPMGSPCNVFGTEPNGGNGPSAPSPAGTAMGSSPFPNCSRAPNFWSVIQGPETGKVQGDRFMTVRCEGASVDNCDAGKANTEYSAADSKGYQGYFFLVKVGPEAVGQPITLQLFDPAFVYTRQQCQALTASVATTGFSASQPYNDYVRSDQGTRYRTGSASTSPSMCPGDDFVGAGSGPGANHPMTTSFVLRDQTDTQDPMKAGVTTGSDGKACIKQYGSYFKQTSITTSAPEGILAAPNEGELRKMNTGYSQMTSTYNQQLAKVFHSWTDFCTFTPTRQGDYYLQVRTNVALGGTPEPNTNGLPSLIYQGNTAAAASEGDTTVGEGANGYAIRAVVPGHERHVAVSGYDRMPIFENGTSTTATFNLMRVLPGAKGYSVSFSFFDVGDATGTGTIKVLPPLDATGSITTTPFPNGCWAEGGAAGSGMSLGPTCTATIGSSTNDGKLETLTIPIPSDYECDFASNGGCWYRVQVTFGSGAVFDTTTWTAGIISDPVRLVE